MVNSIMLDCACRKAIFSERSLDTSYEYLDAKVDKGLACERANIQLLLKILEDNHCLMV